MMDAYFQKTDLNIEENVVQAACMVLEEYIEKLENSADDIILPDYWLVPEQRKDNIYSHLHFELFIQIQGINRFFLADSTHDLEPGQMLLVPRDTFHGEKAVEVDGKSMHLLFMVWPDEIALHFGGKVEGTDVPDMVSQRVYFNCRKNDCGSEMIEAIIRRFYTTERRNMDMVRHGLVIFLSYLRDVLSDGAYSSRWGHHSKVDHCRRLIISNLKNRKLTVKSLAKMCDCTPNYLSLIFHKETGLKVTEFINHERLKKVQRLLVRTDYSVSEIAWNCGYDSANYMSRMFKREMETRLGNIVVNTSTVCSSSL